MRKPILFILSILLVVSCNSKHEANSFSPITQKTEKRFKKTDFNLITNDQLLDHEFWMTLNHSHTEIGVFSNGGNLLLAEAARQDPPFYFDLEDGKLESINNGEFGGQLNFIPSDKNESKTEIAKLNVSFIFRFDDRLYFLCGLAHGMDSGGGLFELKRKGNSFEFDLVLELKSAPEAMTIHKDQIFIAGHQNFSVIKDLKKEVLIPNAFWHSLYPNSVTALDDDLIYIGFRGGYAKYSTFKKEMKYYKYKFGKESV